MLQQNLPGIDLELMHIPFFWDLDLTLTEEYQQYPLFRKYESRLREQFEQLGIRYETPHDYFRKTGPPQSIMGYLNSLLQDSLPGMPFEGLTNEELCQLGREIKPAQGVHDFFPALSRHFEGRAVLHHFIVSAGVKPLVSGFVSAQGIEKHIEDIASSEFEAGGNGVISSVKSAVSPFDKNEYIISFMKGNRDMLDMHMFRDQYRFKYPMAVLVGDGYTDTAMFSLGKSRGGTACCVYEPGSSKAYDTALSNFGRRVDFIDYVMPRNYSPGGITFNLFVEVIERKLSARCRFNPGSLYNYHTGTTTHPDEVAMIKSHLAKCTECSSYFDKVMVLPHGLVKRESVTFL